MSISVADIRNSYSLGSFSEQEALDNPFLQFDAWWQQAVKSQIDEVNAFTLATVDTENKPHARTVLLKDFSAAGFSFFTNYNSHKGQQISANPNAAICFFWKELERQIRIEGQFKKLSDEASDVYFNSRPFGSRIGAIASPQSQVIESRTWLEENEKTILKTYNEDNIVRPKHWGGYILTPTSFEFWQGRPSRLHDRILYTSNNNIWIKQRLAP